MRAIYTPPIVGEDVENTQQDDQEGSGPLGLEADSDHDACSKTEKRDKYTTYAPFSLKDEPNKQEYEQDAPGKEEARGTERQRDQRELKKRYGLLLAICLTN